MIGTKKQQSISDAIAEADLPDWKQDQIEARRKLSTVSILWDGRSRLPCWLGIKQFKRQAGGSRAGVDAYKQRQWDRVKTLKEQAEKNKK